MGDSTEGQVRRAAQAPTRRTEVQKITDFARRPEVQATTRIFIIRTSGDSKPNFEAMFNAGVALMPDDPDVKVLARIGFKIVLPEGAEDRERLGALEIRRGSVTGGWGTKLLGWAIPIGRTLFVLYLDTARKADLPGETPDQSRNAFTEGLCELIRAVRPLELYTPLFNRLVRSTDFGGQLLRTIRQNRVSLWVANQRVEMGNSDSHLRTLLDSWFAARDADDTVSRLAGIEANMYSDGDWFPTTLLLPFTWRAESRPGINPLTGESELIIPDKHRLEVTPGSVPVFDQFVEMLMDRSLSLAQIGKVLGTLGVRSRNPGNFKALKTLDELAQPASAISSLIAMRWLDAWLSGRYRVCVRVKSDLRTTHPGLANTIAQRETKNGDEQLWMDLDLPMPFPARGYWLTEAQYDRILEVRHDPTPQRVGRAASSGNRRPLSSLAQWADLELGVQHRLATFDSSGAYTCLARPLENAFDARGRSLGWGAADRANKLAVVSAVRLHQSIARALLDLASSLEGQTAVLRVPVRDHEAAPLQSVFVELRAAEELVRRIQVRLEGIRQDRQEARGQGDEEEVRRLVDDRRRAESELADAHGHLAEVRERANGVPRPPTPEVETSAIADLGSLEAVGVALNRCGPKAPPELNEALELLLRSSLRVVPDPTGLSVTWTATVEVPLLDGTRGFHTIRSAEPVAGVAFTSRRSDQPGPDWDDRLAAAYFDSGRSLEDVCAQRGIDPSGKADTYPVKRLKEWLRTHGVVNDSRRAATIDAPPEVRTTLARLLRGGTPTTVYEERLLAAYTADEPWGPCWAASTHADSRALHNVVETLGVSRVDPVEAAEVASLTWQQVLGASNVLQVSRADGRAITVEPAVERNWGRGYPPSRRWLSIRRCPHPDCLGRRRNRKAGLLIQLAVPETQPTGLICRECRRSPDDPKSVFPALYLLPWVGGRRTQVSGRWIGSHLA